MTDKRILVLGSGPHAGVTSFGWNELPIGLSVADFDVLVLNFASLEESENEPIVDSQRLPKREQIARLVFSPDSEVVVLGSPDLALKSSQGGEFGVGWWLPFYLDINREYGTEIKVSDSNFAYYFRYVSRWNAFVRETTQPSISPVEYARIVTPDGSNTEYRLRPVAQTRFGEAVGFSISMTIRSASEHSNKQAGPVFWLPRADLISAYDAAELILKVRYNVLVETEAPDWAEPFTLPHEQVVRAEIAGLNEQMSELHDSLQRAHQRLKHESRFRALLFERGDVLEKLVRDAFRELGATVEERPSDREDGRFIDPFGRRAIIEVKGRTGPAKLSDVRQLHHWVADAVAEEDWEGKGILIVNAFADSAIGERAEPFPANSVRAAVRFEQCLLTTTQLFSAIRAKQEQVFDSETFWNALFQTTGICRLADLAGVKTKASDNDS